MARPGALPAADYLADGLAAALPFGALLILAGLPAGAMSLLLRFRRARGLERLQLRWLMVGAMLAAWPWSSP